MNEGEYFYCFLRTCCYWMMSVLPYLFYLFLFIYFESKNICTPSRCFTARILFMMNFWIDCLLATCCVVYHREIQNLTAFLFYPLQFSNMFYSHRPDLKMFPKLIYPKLVKSKFVHWRPIARLSSNTCLESLSICGNPPRKRLNFWV